MPTSDVLTYHNQAFLADNRFDLHSTHYGNRLVKSYLRIVTIRIANAPETLSMTLYSDNSLTSINNQYTKLHHD